MAADVENTFLELGRYPRQLLDRDPELFKKVVDKTPLKRRKAYYLVEAESLSGHSSLIGSPPVLCSIRKP